MDVKYKKMISMPWSPKAMNQSNTKKIYNKRREHRGREGGRFDP